MDKQKEELRFLDDFARLCSRSMREGFALFTDSSFIRFLNGNNRTFLALYKGMSENPVTYQHLEEFLVSTGKKEPIELSLDKQNRGAYHLESSQKDTLYIYKNTWGYVRMEIETEGDFLEVEKKVVTSDDFIGKVYGLEYILNRDKLGKGRSFGRIKIHTVHQDLEYEVEASAQDETEILPAALRDKKRAWLMRDYLQMQLHKLDFRSWLDRAGMMVGEMREEDPEDAGMILYDAYLEWTREDTVRAMEILWPLKDKKIPLKTEMEQGAYLYLAKEIGLLPEEKKDIRPALKRLIQARPDNFLLLHIYQVQFKDRDSVERIKEMEACFTAGCTSPFLYLEAWNLIRREEALLRKLTPFMIQVLCFGQRNGRMTESMMLRTALLSENLKTFTGSIYRLLCNGYARWPEKMILEAICKLILRDNPFKKEYHEWYARAVEADLHITRLYEYFMETYEKPASEEIPLPIRMFFSYNRTLGEKKSALLFASVVLHKSSDPVGYSNYVKIMKKFAEDGLRAGKINENYAVLYREFFEPPKDAETGKLLPDVLFRKKVVCTDKKIRRVVVSHYALKETASYPLVDGTAYPSVYGEDACILL